MGVQHLWDLLAAAGLPARIEALVGKKCAIDASFWLSHCLASESNMRHGGDVIGVFFLRICYLLEKGIKPIFVFDGKPPVAKRKTLIKRRLLQNKRRINHNLLAFQALASQMRKVTNVCLKKTINNSPCPKGKKNILALEYEVNDTIIPKDLNLLTNDNADITTFAKDYVDNNSFNPSTSTKEINSKDIYDSHIPLGPLSVPKGLFNDTNCEGDPVSPGDFELNEKKLSSMARILKSTINLRNNEDDYYKLADKLKYEIMNKIREINRVDNRAKSIELKESISEYSKHQIESYIKDVAIMKEIEKLKRNISAHYPNAIKDELHHPTSNNLFIEEIYDYNSINFNRIKRKKRFMNNLNVITPPNFVHSEPKFPQKTLHTNGIFDESTFATDEEIFGDLISDVPNNDNNHSLSPKNGGSDEEFEVIEALDIPKQEYAGVICNINQVIPQKYESLLDCEDTIQDKALKPEYSNDGSSEEIYILSPKRTCIDETNKNDLRDANEVNNLLNIDHFPDSSMHGMLTCTGNSNIIQDYHDAIQKMLKLFGIPYIVAPSEAESQCAHLNESGACYAVITDDSDALVFGANRVLKNFYNSNIFEVYTSERLFSQLGIGRQELALIAIICGCDYTTGIKGVGIINALEIIKAYPTFNDLYEFRKWATSDCDLETAISDPCPLKKAYKEAHINYRIHWTFSSDFPNLEAYNLLLHPNITNEFKLSWVTPNIPAILTFMEKNSTLPKEEVECCINTLMTKKSQQFIIEDILPEICSSKNSLSSLKHVRRTLNTNLSSFRKLVSSLSTSSSSKRVMYINKPDYYVSKITSKRMLNSIISIKERCLKSKYSDSF
ncbi:DNA-repair protein xp-G, putative [Theileria equi strain WA]|uniref:DNA-repair protein xp-G, putative n=1 Tax=Theileria equi strain WA TaxID=1537102 RepID=L0B0J4_THEEQ|nr:DNA-repair protein xp-G, putative [Theileria equi strain WA]AFZ81372.1 DNA-repair protein xp-G, putative [Theileria equi strain WA]|eukprot:XP_004831038.1 DNA-repair protein xp-G, putative [Theileria equi strain WA]